MELKASDTSGQDLAAMVQAIAAEVLRQLRQDTPEKPRVRVLAKREAGLAERVQSLFEMEADLVFSGEALQAQKPQRYILPFLSCTAMADLAAGRSAENSRDGLSLGEVLPLLLQGHGVEVLEFEYRAYADTAPAPLYALYEGLEKKLASFGLKEVSRKKPDTLKMTKNLITEQDVLQAKNEGASFLWIPMGAKVTPLAEESARNLNVKIVKR